MKKVFVMAALVAVVLSLALPALAGSFWGVILSAGSEKDSFHARMMFTDQDGKVLDATGGIVRIAPNKELRVVIIPEGAKKSADWNVGWADYALVNKETVKTAAFDVDRGWSFAYTPQNGVSPLNVFVKKNGAKKDFFRVIFKVTYDSDPLTTYTNLFVVVGEDAAAKNDLNWEKLNAAFAQQNDFNQRTSEAVANLDSRIANLENWAQAATNQRPAQPVRPTIKIGYTIKVLCTDGRPYMGSYTICLADNDGEVKISKSGQSTICMAGADPGTIRVKIETPQGSSDWVEFNAQTGCQVILRVGGVK